MEPASLRVIVHSAAEINADTLEGLGSPQDVQSAWPAMSKLCNLFVTSTRESHKPQSHQRTHPWPHEPDCNTGLVWPLPAIPKGMQTTSDSPDQDSLTDPKMQPVS